MRMMLAALVSIAGLAAAAQAAASAQCSYRQSAPPPAAGYVDRGNWLAAEHLRIGLQAPLRFMPGIVMHPTGRGSALAKSPAALDLDRITATDPDDGSTKPLRQVLDARLYADGIIVLKGEQIALEYARPGFSANEPRLLMHATRPIIATMIANAAERGKLAREKSVVRVIPELSRQSNLRKTSVQRLLDGRTGLTWSVDDRRQWLAATGWGATPITGGVRPWLKSRRSWPRDAELPVSEAGGPEGELLVWALESAGKEAVSHIACESLLGAIGAEDDAYWLTDPAGIELADGLALSLRDFARFGLGLIASRTKPAIGAMAPKWLVEALAASVTRKDPMPDALRGLGQDAAWRYRYASLGTAHQAAIVGPFGNSLFVDFDRKIVIAIYASFPRDYSALMLQTLRSVWSAVEAADNAQRGEK